MKICQNTSCRAPIGDHAAFCPKCGTAAPAVAPVAPPPPPVGLGRPLAPPPPPMRVAPPIQPEVIKPAAPPPAETPAQVSLTTADSIEKVGMKAEAAKKSSNTLWMLVFIFLVCAMLGYFASN